MSSDSSDDEPNLNLLREACDENFLNDSLYKSEEKRVKTDEIKKIPSLRPGKVEEVGLFDVTPEFQGYVAKSLGKILDKHLNELLIDKLIEGERKTKKKKRLKRGVKLFYDSEDYIDLNHDDVTASNKPRFLINKNLGYNEHNKEEIKSIVVSSEDVLNQTELKNWALINKGKLFRYKKDKNGLLNSIE
ncbi:protein CUSTOS-like [Onthophagus taurus]|uniref:protein CUSTOS-like n=1 Tax=Onthophagus taurus TaxID=166361 RepID=UPI0039BE768E